MDKINANRIKRRSAVTPVCKKLVSFDYKTVGTTSVTFQYQECGGLINTVTFPLSPTGGSFDTYLVADSPTGEFCLKEGTLVRIAGLLAINTFVYEDCDL